jgi:DNA polymerase-1
MVIKDASKMVCDHIGVAFDAPEPFRYKIYPRYKGNRRTLTLKDILGIKDETVPFKVDIDVYTFLKQLKTVLRAAGIRPITVDEMEADDVLAAGALCLAEEGHAVLLATRDKDLMQVVGYKNIKMYWPGGKKNPDVIADAKTVFKSKGVRPDQIRDYLCLLGDAGDNIPGVPGIGKDRAVKLLTEHDSIGRCLNSDSKWGKKLRGHKDKLLLARKLVTLRTDCWAPDLKELALGTVNEKKLIQLIGQVPTTLNELHANSNLSTKKGLFR